MLHGVSRRYHAEYGRLAEDRAKSGENSGGAGKAYADVGRYLRDNKSINQLRERRPPMSELGCANMSFDETCFYCTKDARLSELMIEIAALEVSTLFLFKEQTYRGRCLLAYRSHAKELFDTGDDLPAFARDVARAARAVDLAMKPGKINYGAYADKQCHLHFHLVPKYLDGHTWGSTFEMMPTPKVLLSDAEYAALVAQIQSKL